MSDYQKELKNPKWQKKRLEIMNRDGFSCQVCKCGLNDGVTLNVHHISYKPGMKPWEYSNSNLITLCEKCHQKIHKGEIVLPKNTEKGRGIVYYMYSMKNNNGLSPNESIVYSVLLYHSQMENKEFYKGNRFCISKVKEYITKYTDKIPYFTLNTRELIDRTEMSFPTVRKILVSLEDKGYIGNDYIKCPLDLLKEGYIKIPKNTGVKGRQLIFYGFLVNRAKRYKGTVDTWAYRFKELCGVDADDAYFMIKQLKKKGLVERLDDGKLKVNKVRKGK